eukprot:symbB.v1.2.033192.t1/scaffold4025.1/size46064/4
MQYARSRGGGISDEGIRRCQMARTLDAFFAEIDRYEIIEEPSDPDNPLAKGMEVLKARIPLMGQGSHAEFVAQTSLLFVKINPQSWGPEVQYSGAEWRQLSRSAEALCGVCYIARFPEAAVWVHFDTGAAKKDTYPILQSR